MLIIYLSLIWLYINNETNTDFCHGIKYLSTLCDVICREYQLM